MRIFYLFALLPLTAPAGFNHLVQEFLSSHLQLKINASAKSQAIINRDRLRGTKTWNLAISTPQTSSYFLRANKGFEWGGGLQLGHTLNNKDPSKRFFAVSLSQDLGKNFFGRQFYTLLEKAHQGVHLNDIVLSQKNQKELNLFYQNYLSARLKKTLLSLQQLALQRSQKRLTITRKRVSDGLSEKTDFYSAQIEYVRKQEEFTDLKFRLVNALGNLSQVLYRPVLSTEIAEISPQTKIVPKIIDYDLQQNLELKQVESQLKQLALGLKQVKLHYLPSIRIHASYLTQQLSNNNIMLSGHTPPMGDTASALALSLTDIASIHPEKNDHELIFSLEMTMPLTFTQERLNEAHKKIEIMSLKLTKRQLLQQLRTLEKILQKEITARFEKLKFSRRRIDLAKKNLQEHTRLYNIGRTDFDGLIRAEENLIGTQHSHANNWLHYHLAVAKKAALYGKLLATIGNNN